MNPERLCRDVRRAEPLALHTSFRTGGPARWLAVPQNEQELLALLAEAEQEEVPTAIMGRGSNLLISDEGFDGLVIKITFGGLQLEAGLVRAEAGISLRQLYETALGLGFTGLEFAAGIPGSLGGAVMMNAGAYGGEMKDVVRSVRWRAPDGTILELPAEDLAFGYRESRFTREGGTVLSVLLDLPRGDVAASRQRQAELMARRRQKQPLDLPSAGSTFKRPPGTFAGALVEMCGLRGASVGGAAVSSKHCGFVVNTGRATSADIWRLICQIRDTVHAETGIELEPEVKLLGEFGPAQGGRDGAQS